MNNNTQNNIWDNVWKKDVYSKPDLREKKATIKVEWLLRHGIIKKSTIVLDLGCGGGYISRELFKKTGAQIYGIDSSKEAIRLSNEKSKNFPIFYINTDISKLPFNNDFADVILCIGVLEHVKNYDSSLSEIRRVLKNDGLIYTISSNRNSFIYEQKIIRQKIGGWNYGYQKNWTKNELEKIFLSHGFLTEYINVDKGIGNFKIIDFLDKIFSSKEKPRGRYIYYIGRNNK